jgi:hypothetical protein
MIKMSSFGTRSREHVQGKETWAKTDGRQCQVDADLLRHLRL